jgi:hypothetical protein
MIVAHICNHIADYTEEFQDVIKVTYGSQSPNVPGPFSMKGYLAYMLNPTSWADEVVIAATARMFNITISILNVELGRVEDIEHSGPYSNADILLIYGSNSHYSPAGNHVHS